jgi:uncharacterized protein
MRNSAIVKTVSAHKALFVSSLVLLVTSALVGLALSSLGRHQDGSTVLHAGNQNYELRVVTTIAAQQQGLGDTVVLPPNEGMLFAFGNQDIRCFWMKGMHFPLDIVWLDAQKRVTYIQSDAQPDSYPHSFCPSEPAQYVIELNAGQVRHTGMRIGQTLTF